MVSVSTVSPQFGSQFRWKFYQIKIIVWKNRNFYYLTFSLEPFCGFHVLYVVQHCEVEITKQLFPQDYDLGYQKLHQKPIRCYYSDHLTSDNQSEVIIQITWPLTNNQMTPKALSAALLLLIAWRLTPRYVSNSDYQVHYSQKRTVNYISEAIQSPKK